MQHPYINFGPIQQQQQDEDGTMPPALPPKRSSRSHPGSFRSDGIDIYYYNYYGSYEEAAKF